ncbi:choice-of-anchor Q domain-containing protein [Gabonia massiliensis]|uniref:choice-of-anchor Q domain-containing protein n=1 Tax=Gabonia massiliensis TaxID=1686296 RepID=UPI0009E9943C|nr:choice-of-anchor Q domain-containing protein [Gabonia massiliensis]
MKTQSIFFMLFLGFSLMTIFSSEAVINPISETIYVDASATGTNDGSSWSNAATSLAEAIKYANTNDAVTKILVAEGVYMPAYKVVEGEGTDQKGKATTDRDKAFLITRSNLLIEGGYPTGGSDKANFKDNPVILSGDLDGDGVLSNGDVYHVVVVCNSFGKDLTIKGFIIQGGNANASGDGSIYVVTQKNLSRKHGGGMFVQRGGANLEDIVFKNNNAASFGGGAVCTEASSNMVLNNVAFEDNKASQGGALSAASSSTISGTNMLFVNNSAQKGGAVAAIYSGTMTVTNATMFGNSASSKAGAAYYNGKKLTLQNSIVWNCGEGAVDVEKESQSITRTNCLIEGEVGAQDPMFVDVENGDFRLQAGSPAINMGDNALIPDVSVDLDGLPRSSGPVDMGVYEYLFGGAELTPVTVDYDGKEYSLQLNGMPENAADLYTCEYIGNEPKTDAGEYTIEAKLTDNTGTYPQIKITGKLIINKASQSIIFDAITDKYVGMDPVQLTASASSGLAVTFTSDNPSVVSVTSDGLLSFLSVGSANIIASQTGNNNYKAAEDQIQVVNVLPNNVISVEIYVNDKLFGIFGETNNIYDIYYSVGKDNMTDAVDVKLIPAGTGTITGDEISEGKISLDVSKPLVKNYTFTLTTGDGSKTKQYNLKIERYFEFDAIVKQRWNNTLAAVNNPDNNGGYNFTSYKWYRKAAGESEYKLVGTDQIFSAGSVLGSWLNEKDEYYLEVEAEDNWGLSLGTLRTDNAFPTLKELHLRAYPNPVAKGTPLIVELDTEMVKTGALVEILTLQGVRMYTTKVVSEKNIVDLPQSEGTYIVRIFSTDKVLKEMKVIVK